MKTTLLFLCSLIAIVSFSQSKATYNITFQSTWNMSDHGTLPGNAHWSDLVGATHNSNVTFLEMGQPASQGIENVAELGSNGVFNSEVQSAINDGNADRWLQQSIDPFAAIASTTFQNIEVDENYSLLTLASMIAPSPDWMIAVNSINLRENNNWKALIEIDLFPYDAGTEEGFGYSIDNSASPPGGVITNIAGAPNYPFNANKIGTLTIELQQVLNVSEFQNSDTQLFLNPNPSNGLVNIKLGDNLSLNKIEVYDILGKLAHNKYLYFEYIDLSRLKSGVYVAKFYFEDLEILTRKLIKN